MADPGVSQLLDGKDEGARCEIARRVGERLSVSDVSEVDRRAAETLARVLTADAIERVRCALSEVVRFAPSLPKDIALKIAHDVDAVAVPFLEATEVFSDSEWQQLVLTLSRGALVAVSGRPSMSEELALRLAELGDSVVAGTLVENPATPMTQPVCHTIMDRFEAEMWVLDKLARRDDLITEIAAALTLKVSGIAREKLMQTYELDNGSVTVLSDAETAALVQLAKQTDRANVLTLARRLKQENKLTTGLALAALRNGSLEFCAAALSLLSESRFEHASSVILRADAATVIRLLAKAGVVEDARDEFWTEIEVARKQHLST
jgi:uncharacterized protein (DUF2336 family)